MASNPITPYTLEFPQITRGFAHTLEVGCDVIGTPVSGDDPADVELRTQGTPGNNLETLANAFWTVARDLYSVETLCSTYTLWQRNANNNDRTFISGGVLTSPDGWGGGALVLASEAIFTFRSAAGGILRLTLEEHMIARNDKAPLSSETNPAIAAFRNFIMGASNFIIARDRGFPVAPMNESFGQNEKTWRRRYRA